MKIEYVEVTEMDKGNSKNTRKREQPQAIEISDKQIEIFARRLLPEIRKFFADEAIQKEFEEWKRKKGAA